MVLRSKQQASCPESHWKSHTAQRLIATKTHPGLEVKVDEKDIKECINPRTIKFLILTNHESKCSRNNLRGSLCLSIPVN